VQGWIRDGLVLVNGEIRRVSYSVNAGEAIRCTPRPKETAANLEPEPGELVLIHQDEHLLAIDKPAGMAVHPGAGRPDGTLVNRLLAAYPELGSVGGTDRPGIVHRLDIDTTGLLLVARTEAAYQQLTRAFAERRVRKRYLGVVFGVPSPPRGVIELPLGRHPNRRKEMAVRSDGRQATTAYEVRATGSAVALVDLDLRTGRTHQIRVHLKALGHPLVGDTTYAGNRWRGAPKALQSTLSRFPRPALHALSIELQHPVDSRPLRLTAPVPEDILELWEAMSDEAFPSS
jgi:23S rRNA pseudouridine1911/1915/1917 synthase